MEDGTVDDKLRAVARASTKNLPRVKCVHWQRLAFLMVTYISVDFVLLYLYM